MLRPGKLEEGFQGLSEIVNASGREIQVIEEALHQRRGDAPDLALEGSRKAAEGGGEVATPTGLEPVSRVPAKK